MRLNDAKHIFSWFWFLFKMTNFLLSQHLFDDDVVELVPSLYA
jgi:hypothetical protein